MNYFDALVAGVPDADLADKAGLTYVSAASALRLAGRPQFEFVNFDGKPYLEMFGGAVVAVDVPVGDVMQRMWLPVMDQDNKTLDIKDIKLTDVNNSLMRCMVKAIACVTGYGMSVYLGTRGDGTKASTMLGVTPESNLAEVQPIVATLKEGGAAYVEWGVATAAARITDSSFYWNVLTAEGLPYREVLGGALVDVATVYRGQTRVLSLPIMDAAFNAIPVEKVSPFDWNKTVMRALTKCLAFNSGYGISVYSGEDLGFLNAEAKRSRKPRSTTETPAAKAEKPAAPVESTKPADSAAPNQTTDAAQAVLAAEAQATATSTTAGPVDEPEYQTRFKSVMDSKFTREGLDGLVSLFALLDASTKFEEKDKPNCLRLLTTNIANKLKTALPEFNLTALLTAMEKFGAMSTVPMDAKDMIAARYVQAAIKAGVESSDPGNLSLLSKKLLSANVAASNDDLLHLADLANVPAESLELLKEVLKESAAA